MKRINKKLNSFEIEKSICFIQKFDLRATGFFLKIEYNSKPLYMLVTAHHAIPYPLVDDEKNIQIIIGNDSEKQIINITLDCAERKILCLKDKDITAVEILDKDKIKEKVKFLNYDSECNYTNYMNYLNIEIFIMHHPNCKEYEIKGNIIKIREPMDFEFQHNLYTEEGSSGAPILLFEKSNEEFKVIGVHTSASKGKKSKIGTFINTLIEEIKNKNFYKNKKCFGISKKSKLIIEL